MDTPEFEMFGRSRDLAHVVDMRVPAHHARKGVGKALWKAAEDWALRRGAVEIRVETQDVNVPACRFYQAMGSELRSARDDVYGPDCDEWQLIWAKKPRRTENVGRS